MVKTERNLRDSYKAYKASTDNPVDIKTYLMITGNYHKFLLDKVVDGEEITLPARMGTLSVVGTEQEVRFGDDGKPILPPDWVKTRELWEKSPEAKAQKKLVYLTSDIRYKFLWSKKRVLVTNKMLYSLRLTRTNKRAVSSAIKQGKEYHTK